VPDSLPSPDANYTSGEDYVVEFLGYRFSFVAADFEGRVVESLVYWLRKLIFRGAWLDHQVKRSALEVVWDEDEAEFAYQHPDGGGRPLLELAPVPSWHELQFRP
jgi:hypothetical protein